MSTNVGSIHYDVSLNTDKFNQAANRVSSRLDSLGAGFKNVGQKMSDVGKSMTLGVTLPALAMGGVLLKSASDLEKTARSFDVLVGNGKKAAKLFADIKKFADQTPFEFPELAKASTTLLGYGVSVDDVLNRLKRLGDAAAASGGDLNGITLAYAQMIGRGKVTGDNLRQLTENMVTLREELSQVSGIPMKDLDKAIEGGKISTDMLNKALDIATNKGGKFFGGTEQLAKTFSGRMSTLKDQILEVGRNLLGVKVDDKLGFVVQEGGVFDRLSKLLPKISEGAKKIGDAFANLTPKQQDFVLAFAGILIISGPLLMFFGSLTSSIGILFETLKSPVFWKFIVVLAILAGIVYLVAKNWDTLKKYVDPVINTFKNLYNEFQTKILPILKMLWAFMVIQFKKAWNDIKIAVEQLKNAIKPFMPQIMQVAKVIGVIFVIFVLGAITIIGLLIAAFARIIGIIARVISWFVQMQIKVWNALKSIQNSVINAFKSAGSMLYNAGKSIIQGLINGIKDMGNKVKDAVSGVLNKARNLLPFSPAKEGPFSGKGWTLYSGQSIMEGFAEGIRRNANMPQDALNKALSGSMQATLNPQVNLANAQPQSTSINNNIYGNITLGDQSAVSAFFDKLNRNSELSRRGMTTA